VVSKLLVLLVLLVALFPFLFFFPFQELGQLEIKHGLMQLAEALSFIHRNARLIHRGISPEVGASSKGMPGSATATSAQR